jgi:transcriptional regulator with XRE-family HTH domain
MASSNETLIAFGKAVRSRRAEIGLSQEELALQADLDRTYIGGVERGERNLSLINIVKIAKALRVSGSELLAATEEIERGV